MSGLGDKFADYAMDFFDYLREVPSYLSDNWSDLLDLTLEHAQVVVVAMLVATVVGVGLGVLTYRVPPVRS